MPMSDSFPRWTGEADQKAFMFFYLQKTLAQAVFCFFTAYVSLSMPMRHSGSGFALYAPLGIVVLLSLRTLWWHSRFFGVRYIIDEFGVRAINSRLNTFWALLPEHVSKAHVEILGELGRLTWTDPYFSSKSGRMVFPGEGFWFVKDHRNMVRAFEAWQVKCLSLNEENRQLSKPPES